jgi:hypothetical protein
MSCPGVVACVRLRRACAASIKDGANGGKGGKAAQSDEAALDKVLLTQDSALVQMLLELLLPYVDDDSPPALQIRTAGASACFSPPSPLCSARGPRSRLVARHVSLCC